MTRRGARRPPPLRTLMPALAAVAAAVLVVVVLSQASGGWEQQFTAVPGQLSYRADNAERSAAILGDRVAAVGLADVTVRAGSPDTVVVEFADDAAPGTRATVQALTTTGRLRIYDYEGNLLTPEPVSQKAAQRRADAAEKRAIAVRTLPPAPAGWVALSDEPAVTERDVSRANAVTDRQTSEPSVAIEFTDAGETAFETLTRGVARRGADRAQPGDDPTVASQHIAVVLDGALVALPRIDYRAVPNGIEVESEGADQRRLRATGGPAAGGDPDVRPDAWLARAGLTPSLEVAVGEPHRPPHAPRGPPRDHGAQCVADPDNCSRPSAGHCRGGNR